MKATAQTVAVIGYGAIGAALCRLIAPSPGRLTVLVRSPRMETVRAALLRDGITAHVTDAPVSLLSAGLVVECAGHGAVDDYGADVLGAGVDLAVASVGALADADRLATLQAAARAGRAQLLIPPGAIGGIDALAAARIAGIDRVVYTGRKPPAAWAGSPAERAVDLQALTEPAVFYEGTARQAARDYPKNANVAATLALAGAGMDDTQVRLIADPAATANTHEVSVRSAAVDFDITLTGRPMAANPRTSQLTVLSLARLVANRSAALAV
jgi:aspartate dehydrogenase